MRVIFYDYAKRVNSTKHPSDEGGVVYTCELKENTNVINPTLRIKNIETVSSPVGFTYVYIREFDRYYFVRTWRWMLGVWECDCAVDVLASFKTEIGGMIAYVERAASESDGSIIDRLYPVTTNFSTTTVNLISSYYNVAPSNGCFVLGIVNNANFATSQPGGAVTYYVLTPAQMRSLMHYLLGTGFLDDNGFPVVLTTTQQLTQDTAKALVNPVQYIASCLWFPFSATDIAESGLVDIKLGYYDLDSNVATGYKLGAFAITETITGDIPVHPMAYLRGKYLNYAPFTRMLLTVPPFGTIPLDTSYCEIGSYLYCTVYIDLVSGKAQMRVTIQPDSEHVTANTNIITEATAMFGVPIQLAQMVPDVLSAVGAAIQFGTNIGIGAASDGIGGAASAAIMSLGSVANAAEAIMPQVRTAGVDGSFLLYIMPPRLIAQYFVPADDDNAELGRPLCQVKTINTLSGYIKCGEVSIDISAYQEEKTMIYQHMINGFFYE